MAKLGITLDDELLERMDNVADSLYMSRSGFISLCVSEYLLKDEALLALNNLSSAMQNIAKSGFIDDDCKQAFSDIERVAGLLSLQNTKNNNKF